MALSTMTHAGDLRIQIEQLLDLIGQESILASELRTKAEEINGGLILLGLSTESSNIVNPGMSVMSSADTFSNEFIFCLRVLARDLTEYKDSL